MAKKPPKKNQPSSKTVPDQSTEQAKDKASPGNRFGASVDCASANHKVFRADGTERNIAQRHQRGEVTACARAIGIYRHRRMDLTGLPPSALGPVPLICSVPIVISAEIQVKTPQV